MIQIPFRFSKSSLQIFQYSLAHPCNTLPATPVLYELRVFPLPSPAFQHPANRLFPIPSRVLSVTPFCLPVSICSVCLSLPASRSFRLRHFFPALRGFYVKLRGYRAFHSSHANQYYESHLHTRFKFKIKRYSQFFFFTIISRFSNLSFFSVSIESNPNNVLALLFFCALQTFLTINI